ncbi:MAG: 50S ribosomal protein L17, partial [Bdellovibrio sp.]
RKFNARKALIRGLVSSLVEHERIATTVEKAKELRRHIERMITLGKKENLATRRVLLSRVPKRETVEKIVNVISPRFQSRPGGYTRIIKIGRRPGDTAEMAFIEFVDYDFKKAKAKKPSSAGGAEAKGGEAGQAKIAASSSVQHKQKRVQARLSAAHKKSVRKMRSKSRAENRIS